MAEHGDKVGYRHPPNHTKFRPGQSGNPSGRKNGSKNISTDLEEILAEEITVSKNGATQTMTKQRALASALISAAIDGDFRATAIVLSHLSRGAQNSLNERTDFDHDFAAAEAHQKKQRGS